MCIRDSQLGPQKSPSGKAFGGVQKFSGAPFKFTGLFSPELWHPLETTHQKLTVFFWSKHRYWIISKGDRRGMDKSWQWMTRNGTPPASCPGNGAATVASLLPLHVGFGFCWTYLLFVVDPGQFCSLSRTALSDKAGLLYRLDIVSDTQLSSMDLYCNLM